MASHFSALKRMRQSEKREAANRTRRTRLRHAVRELRHAISAGDSEKAGALLPEVVSIVDKSRKKGVIKHNTAARFKSRLTARVAKAGKTA
jgi:small subunit ribosomal protein S20